MKKMFIHNPVIEAKLPAPDGSCNASLKIKTECPCSLAAAYCPFSIGGPHMKVLVFIRKRVMS